MARLIIGASVPALAARAPKAIPRPYPIAAYHDGSQGNPTGWPQQSYRLADYGIFESEFRGHQVQDKDAYRPQDIVPNIHGVDFETLNLITDFD